MIISEDQFDELNVHNGDEIVLTYSIHGKREMSQVVSLLEELNADPRWRVDYSRRPSVDQLEIHLIVEQNPFPIAIALIAVTVIAAGLFLYLSLDKVEVIAKESPVAAIGVGLGGVAVAVVAGLVLYWFVGRS